MIGRKISHYHILEKLGQGGMAEVYLAEDVELQRKVALKFFHPLLTPDEEARKRFRREAQLAASLNHPNIVTIYEVGEYEDMTYIAMEYIKGRTLREFIQEHRAVRQTPPEVDAVLQIVRQICEGLQEAHRQGIIHRDLKSDNILIDQQGRIRILDFGLARMKGGTQITRDGARLGTPQYMSPEQIAGEEVDPRSDIFSLGVVWYELLTGELPFNGERDASIIYAIMLEEPRPLSECQPEVPRWMCEVVQQCLNKDPCERFQSVEVLLEQIEAGDTEARGTEPETTIPPSVPLPRGKPGYNRKRPGYMVVFLLLILIGLGIVYRLREPETSGPGEQAERDTPVAVAVLPFSVRGSQEYAYLSEGLAQLLSTQLDGAGALRSIDPAAVFRYLDQIEPSWPNLRKGQAVGERFHADYYIWGTVLEIRGELFWEAFLYKTNQPEKALARASLKAEAGQLFRLVDEMSTTLLSGFSREKDQRLQRLAALTTDSLAALKAYLVGEARMRAGKYQEALSAFQEAVARDPEFALAYYRLSLTADWLTRPELANQAARMAVQHSHRLSEHDRLLLQALLFWQNGDARKAENLYRTIVGINRENGEAWFQLGEVLFHYGPLWGHSILEAQNAFRQVLQLDPRHAPSLWHLARIASVEGNLSGLNKLVKQIESLQPAGEREIELRALKAFSGKDKKQQRKVLQLLREQEDYKIVLAAWTVAVYTPNLFQAMPILDLLTDSTRSPEARALGHLMKAHLELAGGRRAATTAELTRVQALDSLMAAEFSALMSLSPFLPTEPESIENLRNQLIALKDAGIPAKVTPSIFFTVHNPVHPQLQTFLLGMLEARLGNAAQARMHSRKMLQYQGKSEAISLNHDLSLMVEAEISLLQGNIEEALERFQMCHRHVWYGRAIASPVFSRALLRYQYAELLYGLKRFEEALPLYKSFAEYSIYDLIYVAPACRRLGEIYQHLGKKQEAARYYRKFLKLWKKCDPLFRPYLEEAGRQLQLLL